MMEFLERDFWRNAWNPEEDYVGESLHVCLEEFLMKYQEQSLRLF